VNGQQAQSAPSAAPSATSVGDLLVISSHPHNILLPVPYHPEALIAALIALPQRL